MDLSKAIQELYAEKEKLEKTISLLEELHGKYGHRRGRKLMSAEEREEVSMRMRKYWADRRRERGAKADEAKRGFSK